MQTSFLRPPAGALPAFFLGLLGLLLVPPVRAFDFSVGALQGTGEVVHAARTVEPFLGLKLQTLARVVIRAGDHDAVEIQAEGNVLPLITTQVEHGTLVVEDSKRFKSSNAEVTVTVRHLERLEAGGATTVVAEGLSGPSLSLHGGGASAITLKALAVDQLHADLRGACVLKLSGTTGRMALDMGGTAAVQAAHLEAKALTIDAGGTAQALVWATQSLRISVGGVAGVRYYGVSDARVQVGGVAQVRRLGLQPPKPM